jgi:nitrile hydratase subunit beta
MNGAQDLGGMMGFGPIMIEPDEPVFHAAWERRAFALTIASGACGQWNLDIVRHARESLPPADYLAKSYYDIWVTALSRLTLRTSLATEAEFAVGRPLDPPKPGVRCRTAAEVERLLATGTPYDRPAARGALFAVGDAVRTKVMHPKTHTRLPRYARGKVGVIDAVCGNFVFPDSNAHGYGEDPRWCYTVVFKGTELWGEDADPSLTVSIDAWEPYLERT